MQLTKITIATTNTDEMVAFYNSVFHANLREVHAHGTITFVGRIAGIDLVLCPESALGVQATQNRQQFKFMISNIVPLSERIADAGGLLESSTAHPHDGSRWIAVRDPDGNFIEFEQPSAAKIG